MKFAQMSKKHKRRRKLSLFSIPAISCCLKFKVILKFIGIFFKRAVILPTVKEIGYFITLGLGFANLAVFNFIRKRMRKINSSTSLTSNL